MRKTIFPVISDEAAVRVWRKQLVRASATIYASSVTLVVLIAVAIYPEITGQPGKFGLFLIGCAIVAGGTAYYSWWCSQNILESARSRLQSARRFMQDAGHELATPIAIFGSRIQVLERDPKFNAEDISVLSESAGRLSVLVDDMRALARAEAPRSSSDLYIINIVEMVRSICTSMRDAMESRAITLTTDMPSVVTIIGQRDSVERAISNLISNAIRYGREGGQISVSIQTVDDNVVMIIEDDGLGISPDTLPKIFDRFFRAERLDVHKTSGSGLGLAIVKAVVENHSGKIYAESELGKFTRFTVELPKSPVHPVMRMLNRSNFKT